MNTIDTKRTDEDLVMRIYSRVAKLDHFRRRIIAAEIGETEGVKFNLAFWEALQRLDRDRSILFVPEGKHGAYRLGNAFDRVRRARGHYKRAGRQLGRGVLLLPTKSDTPAELVRTVDRLRDKLGRPIALVEAAHEMAKAAIGMQPQSTNLRASRK